MSNDLPADAFLARLKAGADFETEWKAGLRALGVDEAMRDLVAERIRPIQTALPTILTPVGEVTEAGLAGIQQALASVKVVLCHLILAYAEIEILKREQHGNGEHFNG